MNKKIGILVVVVGLLLCGTIFASSGQNLLLKNANILTIKDPDAFKGDILIKDGKVARIGENIKAGNNTEVIDLEGKWIMPGIIDSHSHIAIEGSVNEMGDLMTPEVDIKDVINPEDINIFYALTGGVTSIHTMHGSGNPIGGRGIVLKLRWGKTAEEMIFEGAPYTSKWALGENPTRSNFTGMGPSRYPRTRMGVEASIRLEFEKAKDYMKKWDDYRSQLKNAGESGIKPIPPRKDYRLEVIADILKGKYWIRCHAYQSEEMLSILKLCKEYGLKLVCFEHGLEGYRITNELVEHGVGVSTFADYWSYKWEAYFTMPHAVALMAKRGVLVAINSDDSERMRHLFNDAAKAVRFGGLSEHEALKTLTINPAILMGIDQQTGTIEKGKDADLAVFNKHPLDSTTVCQMTLVDGEVLFDRAKVLEKREQAEQEKAEAEKNKEDKVQ